MESLGFPEETRRDVVDGSPASILVVCNTQDAAELTGALRGEPLPVAGALVRIVTADGGDSTINIFVDMQPEVVVVSASLDHGDTRALIAALRASAPAGSFQIVLIGDARGPIRNALDAADFNIDRFVARPVAAKALRFAVGSSVAAIRRGRPGTEPGPAGAPEVVLPEPAAATRISGQHRAVMITRSPDDPRTTRVPTMRGGLDVGVAPARTTTSRLDAMLDAAVEDHGRDEVVRRTSGGFAIPVEAILAAGGELEAEQPPAVTAPMSVHEVPTRPVSAAELRMNAGAPLDEVDHLEVRPPRGRTMPPPPPGPLESVGDSDIVGESSRFPSVDALLAAEALGEVSDSHELPPGIEAPAISETEGSFEDIEVATPPPEIREEPFESAAPAKEDDSWDAPALPVREPTMILSGDGAAPAAAPSDLDVTERRSDGRWTSTSSVAALSSAEGDEAIQVRVRPHADELDGVEDHLEPADLAGLSVNRPIPAPPPAPSGGEFARELRKKMSAMAQRLFRQGDVPTPPSVDVRPPHDFRTEIDLAEIDVTAERAGSTAVYDLTGDATFAGDDDHGLPTSPGIRDAGSEPAASGTAGGTTTARTSESGDLVRGTSDAAVLIARMFVGEFTGKVTFRRAGDEEKSIYFDGGRPVFASSNLPADRMGELLYREGKITGEQYAGCRDVVLESGRRMGEILVDRGFLKRRELLPAVRRHVEDIIYSLFAWDHGEYRIVPGDGASSERIRLSRHPAAMVLEGVRRKLDFATLERLLGPTTTIVEVADRDKAGNLIAVADLSSEERAALAGMDGNNDLGHVARASGSLLVTVYQLAWAMTLLGVATVRRRGDDDDDQPALVGETDLAIDRDRVRARHRLVAEADYFALLGVRRDATAFEIRRAYESAMRDFDADAFPPELRAELGVEIAEIASVLDEAFRVLRDDRLRGAYLANLFTD